MHDSLDRGPETVPGGPRRVLIVDDRPEPADRLRAALVAGGFTPVLAADGEAAMRIVDAEHPEAVVVDLRMPVLDGWLVLSELGGRRSRPRVVVCSGRARLEDQQRAFDLGADAFLPKPYDVGHLVQAIRDVLAAKAPRAPEPAGGRDVERMSATGLPR